MSDECRDLIKKAVRYLNTKTRLWPDGLTTHVASTPEAHRLLDAVNAACLANDFQATSQCCRAYWTHILSHAPKETPV